MIFKYVRHGRIGFILWPKTDDIWHRHIGDLARRKSDGVIVSAGFVEFDRLTGLPRCYGRSESLGIDSIKDDSKALTEQLGIDWKKPDYA